MNGAVLVRPGQRATGQFDRPSPEPRNFAGEAEHRGVLRRALSLPSGPHGAVREDERYPRHQQGERGIDVLEIQHPRRRARTEHRQRYRKTRFEHRASRVILPGPMRDPVFKAAHSPAILRTMSSVATRLLAGLLLVCAVEPTRARRQTPAAFDCTWLRRQRRRDDRGLRRHQQGDRRRHSRGWGTVDLPAGRYLSFSIRLKSHVTLRFSPGAVLVAADPASGLGKSICPRPTPPICIRTSVTATGATASSRPSTSKRWRSSARGSSTDAG